MGHSTTLLKVGWFCTPIRQSDWLIAKNRVQKWAHLQCNVTIFRNTCTRACAHRYLTNQRQFQSMNKIENGNFSAHIYVIWSYNTPKNMYFSSGIQSCTWFPLPTRCLRDTAKINSRKHNLDVGSITNMTKLAQKAYQTSSNTPKLLSVTFYVPSRFQQGQNHIPMSYIKGEMSHLVLCILAVFTNQHATVLYRPVKNLIILLSEVRNSSFQFDVWEMHKTETKSRQKRKGGRMGI